MSVRFPSRWLLAAALLTAQGLTPAVAAEPPELPIAPKVNGAPQTAPVPATLLPGLLAEPLLLDEEQVSEHGDLPHVALPALPAPRVQRSGLPECAMSSNEVTLRCLLFAIHPLAAFLPLPCQTEVPGVTLPSSQYLEHPPLYFPAEPVRELIPVMPTEVEEIGVMPLEEESELHYEFLALPIDCAHLIDLPCLPRAEIKVGVHECKTGSFLFGVGVELNRTGTVTVSPQPLPVVPQPQPAPHKAPEGPQVRLDLQVIEVTHSGARKLNLIRGEREKASRWAIEVADSDRQKALQAGLNGLREKGHADLVSRPTMVALSGQHATVTVGGSIPVATQAANGQAGVRFDVGTRITCQPVVMADGMIHLDFESEFSDPCAAASDNAVPGVSTQGVHIATDVPPGGTLVISGPKVGGKSYVVVLVTTEVIRAADDEESVPELLSKCRRELSRGHYAAAEDLAQQALERDRAMVAADPLVREFHLLQKVKRHAVLPLGTVVPGDAKGEGCGGVWPGRAKAIGSTDRMIDALMQAYNEAIKEARYRDAELLAIRALGLDADNAVAVAALCAARTRLSVAAGEQPVRAVTVSSPTDVPMVVNGVAGEWFGTEPYRRTMEAMSRFEGDFKAGRYEEAQAAAAQALMLAPGYSPARSALFQASAALAGRPRPEPVPQCTFVGSGLRPALPPVDAAVVSALQKILVEQEKRGPVGGAEEAEPHDAPRKR